MTRLEQWLGVSRHCHTLAGRCCHLALDFLPEGGLQGLPRRKGKEREYSARCFFVSLWTLPRQQTLGVGRNKFRLVPIWCPAGSRGLA